MALKRLISVNAACCGGWRRLQARLRSVSVLAAGVALTVAQTPIAS